MRRTLSVLALLTPLTAFAVNASTVNKETPTAHRLHEASTVLEEITASPDKGIPQDLLSKSRCIVIVPGLRKGALLVGGTYGKGFVSCRKEQGWAAPGAIRMEGLQAGGVENDVILLAMNDRGAERLLTAPCTLDGEIAAGPVGRSPAAEAEILAWSRSRGMLAGVALQGATLRQDSDDNRELYGKSVENRDLVSQGIVAPRSALKLLALLNRYPLWEHS